MPALSQRLTYKRAHHLVRRAKGKASEHSCFKCGAGGKYWAYQHNDPEALTDAKGRPYSGNPDCYEPMCAGCHRQYDIDNDPRVGAAARAIGSWRGQQNKARLKADADYAARMRGVSKQAVKKVQAKRRRCLTCGMVSTPFGLGSHLSASGHTGYEELENAA